jgi:hypothetical protein
LVPEQPVKDHERIFSVRYRVGTWNVEAPDGQKRIAVEESERTSDGSVYVTGTGEEFVVFTQYKIFSVEDL